MTAVECHPPNTRSKSLPEMSALLPTDTKLKMPMPRRCTLIDQRDAGAPDCVMNATLPGTGSRGAKVAFMRTSEVGVRQSHAVGPDDPHAVSPGRLHEIGLRRAPIGAELREAGADDHDATDMR